jgi:hypothetical protein
LTISLDPREQSLLYCELEWALNSALNSYITSQFNAGRLDTNKLKKIVDKWRGDGRPKVIGFRYDVVTQLDLVRIHAADFKFYDCDSSAAKVVAHVDTMIASAKVMRVRTYCQPDTVIAKQLLDSRRLFNMLGCPEEQQWQLGLLSQFFRDRVREWAQGGA